MRIAIIGTGHVGGAVATGLKDKRHRILLGTRDPGGAGPAALADATGASAAHPAEAAAASDIVILAMPWPAARDAVGRLGDLAGKVVIDCMNPLGLVDGSLSLTVGHDTSGGEAVQAWLPGARVVKTLNQVGAEVIARNDHLSHRPAMFMAGDDPAAKEAAAVLLTELGFDPLDAGDLARARLLEPLGMVWINQALARGKGRDWALAAVEARP